MTDTILLKGIVQYCHLIKPSAPKGTNNLNYNITMLIPTSDTQMCQLITQTFDQVTANGFPSGKPANFSSSWKEVDAAKNPELAGKYMQLKISKPADAGQPDFVDANKQPIIDPGADGKCTGQWAYANIWVHTYTQGSVGVKCRPNAVMLTGEMGPIPVEQLTEKPSIDELFAGIGQMATPPQSGLNAPALTTANNAVQPNGVSPPPAPPVAAAPPVPSQPTKTMTDKANGATYDQMIAAGWNDQQLIDHGMMILTSV